MNEDPVNNMNNNTNDGNTNGNWNDCYPPWFNAYLNGADVPGGFQDLNPNLLNMIGCFAGAIVSSNLPFNMQNVIGNWLELAGQYIETYNAQQQYQQGGPGRYYSPMYKNVSNPFTPNTGSDETGNETINTQSSNNNSSNTSSQITIEDLSNQIKELRREIEELKRNK